MFKKPFNKKVGETRQCKICGDTYHTHKPRWRCMKCLAKAQRESAKPYEPKDTYPFDNYGGEAGLRFTRIRKDLRKAWLEGRESITAHYDKQLQEAEDLGIIQWINDRRTDEAKKEMRVRSKRVIRKDTPDTRGYYEE